MATQGIYHMVDVSSVHTLPGYAVTLLDSQGFILKLGFTFH